MVQAPLEIMDAPARMRRSRRQGCDGRVGKDATVASATVAAAKHSAHDITLVHDSAP